MRDAKQIGRYARPMDRRRASGTNTRLDDEAPIDVLRQASEPSQFGRVVRTLRP